MRYIPWNQALETGNPDLDEEHRALYALVNDLNAAALVGVNEVQIHRAITRIMKYASTHFATEEALMNLSAYPDAAEHMAIHAEFAEKAKGLAAAQSAGHRASALDLAMFMQDWLEAHIRTVDRPLVVHLRVWREAHEPPENEQ